MWDRLGIQNTLKSLDNIMTRTLHHLDHILWFVPTRSQTLSWQVSDCRTHVATCPASNSLYKHKLKLIKHIHSHTSTPSCIWRTTGELPQSPAKEARIHRRRCHHLTLNLDRWLLLPLPILNILPPITFFSTAVYYHTLFRWPVRRHVRPAKTHSGATARAAGVVLAAAARHLLLQEQALAVSSKKRPM